MAKMWTKVWWHVFWLTVHLSVFILIAIFSIIFSQPLPHHYWRHWLISEQCTTGFSAHVSSQSWNSIYVTLKSIRSSSSSSSSSSANWLNCHVFLCHGFGLALRYAWMHSPVRIILTRKLCYRKDDRAIRPIYGCPEYFRDSLTIPSATFPRNFHELLFQSTLWMCLQNLKSEALPVPEIIWVPKNFRQSRPGYAPTLLFLQNVNGLLFGWTLWMYLPNLKSVVLPVPAIVGVAKKFRQSLAMPTLPIPKKNPTGLPYTLFLYTCSRFPAIFDWSFGWGLRTPNLGEDDAVERWGSGMMSSYKPSILHRNFSSIFSRFRGIAAFVLQNATFSESITSFGESIVCNSV